MTRPIDDDYNNIETKELALNVGIIFIFFGFLNVYLFGLLQELVIKVAKTIDHSAWFLAAADGDTLDLTDDSIQLLKSDNKLVVAFQSGVFAVYVLLKYKFVTFQSGVFAVYVLWGHVYSVWMDAKIISTYNYVSNRFI